MSDQLKQPIYANKTVLTIGSVAAIILFVVGPVMWAAKKESQLESLVSAVGELRSRVSTLDATVQDAAVRQAKIEVKLDSILEQISDIKKALDK